MSARTDGRLSCAAGRGSRAVATVTSRRSSLAATPAHSRIARKCSQIAKLRACQRRSRETRSEATLPDSSAIPSKGKPPRRVQYLCDMYFPEVHAGIVAYAQAARWALFDLSIYFPSSLYNYAEECDGILATVCLENLSQWLTRKSCPIVRVACTNQEISTPAVEPDSEGIGARGAEHLLTLGSPTFAFFRGGATRESNLMWQGFSKAIERAGYKAHLLDFSSSPESQRAWLP